MLDISITNSGDFAKAPEKKLGGFHLSWVTSKNFDCLRLLFKTGKNAEDFKKPAGVNMRFFIGEEKKNIQCCAVSENDELRQRIMVKLRTELGDVSTDENFGTKLQQLRHQDIYDENNIERIREMILEAVQEDLSDANVVIKKEETTGPFFCQNLNAYVYDGKTQIYKFSINTEAPA